MTNDNEDLITKNLNLAYKLAWQYNTRLKNSVDIEELQSLCFLGLTKAAKHYDKERDIEFSTFAYKVMKNEILRYIKDNLKYNKCISLSTTLNISSTDKDLDLEDIIALDFDLEENIISNIRYAKLYKFISELNEEEQYIVKGYLMGFNTHEIADHLKLNEQEIYKLYRKAINKLRYKFLRDGGEFEWDL